jgi:hypothetical protein
MTNRTGDEGLAGNLAKFLEEEQKSEPGHRYLFREGDARLGGVSGPGYLTASHAMNSPSGSTSSQ